MDIMTLRFNVNNYYYALNQTCLHYLSSGGISVYLLSLIVIGVWLIPQCTVGQIPTACADDDSLENL